MGFELPPGDPDAMLSGLKTVGTVSGDLKKQETTTQHGFAAALGTWKGPRADTFRGASAGIQLQVTEAQSTLDQALQDLDGYARVLRSAIEEIKELQRQATSRQNTVAQQTKGQDPDSTNVTMAQQHCAQYVGQLEQQAEEQRQRVKRAASGVIGVLQAGTALAVPGADKLTPDEIARKVHASTGVDGISSAIKNGTLTGPQAWQALGAPAKALKGEEINDDGSINWTQVSKDVKEQEKEDAEGDENPWKKALDSSLDAWTLATAPPGAVALTRLAAAARNFSLAKAALPEDVMKLSQVALDTGRILQTPDELLNSIEASQFLSKADIAAFAADADLARSTESVVRSGLPEVLDGTAGKLFMGLGFLGDAWTLADPKAPADDKVDAGLNAAGLALVTETGSGLAADGLVASGLIAADASVGWIPVVGWGLVAITAGYEVWKHWDTVKGWAKDAWHGTEWAAGKTWDGAKWVAGKTWDGVTSAASSTWHGAKNLVSDAGSLISHIPHPW